MKTRCPLCFRNVSAFFVLLLALTANIFAQPQYYNFSNGISYNSFPFNIAGGKMIQTYIAPAEFTTPSPAPSGNITKFHVRISTGYPLGPVTYSNFKLIFIDTTIAGGSMATSFYTSPTADTVLSSASYGPISQGGDTWLTFTLGHAHAYNNTRGLLIQIEQTTATGTFAGNFSLQHSATATNRRLYSAGGAPFAYGGASLFVVNCGIDVAPPVVNCSYTWTVQTSGTTSLLYSVKTVSNLVGWAAGAAGTVRRTTDGGTTWGNGNPNAGVITGDIYNIEALDANTAWVTTSPGATFIYKTTNGGTNWTQVYTVAGGFINTIKMVSATNGYAFGDPLAGNWLMLKTVDGGTTWTTLATVPGTGDGRNNCLHVALPHIWFGTGQNTLYHSTDGGTTWTFATTTGITGQVTGIQFNNSTVGLLGGATMVKTTDGGATFTLVTALGTGTISGIEGSGSDYWYVRGTGIFRSTDVGATWTQVHTQTAAQNDISLVADGNGCMVGWSAGTTGTISKMTGVPVAINDPVSQIPTSYRMDQNYPNPFNPTTSITYALPVAGNVELKIYDLLGREVTTLVNTFVNAGTHMVPFDASALSSGVYIYKINSGSFTDSKKMVLIK